MRRHLVFAVAIPLLASCAAHAPPAPIEAAPTAPGVTPAPVAPNVPKADVLLARAKALRAEGDVAGARSRLETAVISDPADEDVRLELADLIVSEGGDLARAEELLQPVVDKDARVHLVRARLAEARGDDGLAAAEYRIALEGTDYPEVRLSRALALERLGMGAEALIEFERVRAANPADSVARFHLADRYEAAGRLREAEAEHRFLTEREPPRASDWERLAGFYERHGRLRDAAAAHERARLLGAHTERSLRPLLPSRN